jgi:pyruvate,water dikinase
VWKNEIIWTPISPWVVRGKVKVFHAANEKKLLPWEILVTRATDPGWTPLFVNAGGILLEVGGVLQHGALVAREYWKPCIAGLEGIMNKLKDGQEIEMDWANWIVKIIK